MFSYLAERLLFVIPTIFFVLVFSFILKSLAPGDEIGAQLEIQGESRAFSKAAYLESYKNLSEELGYHHPIFYVGIRPSYFPDTLGRIIPKARRNLLTSMLRQTKNWNEVSNLNSLLNKVQEELKNQEGTQKSIYNEVIKMPLDKNLSDLKVRARKILALVGNENISSETKNLIDSIQNMEERSTLSYPIISWNGTENQFHFWLKRIFNKKENLSLTDGSPAITKIFKALKWTISLSLIALIIVTILSLMIGYCLAKYANSTFERISSILLYILLTIPTFWLASLAVVFFTTPEYGSWTNIFPSIGIKPSFIERTFIEELWVYSRQLILPILCLTAVSISYLSLQLKSDILNTLKMPFIIFARAKGLTEERVLKSHALPNALLPFVTAITGSLPSIFTGSVIIEVIFNIPGIGRLLLYSIGQSDWPVIFTIVIVISIATIVSYLIGDLLLMRLYPKSALSFNSSTDRAS